MTWGPFSEAGARKAGRQLVVRDLWDRATMNLSIKETVHQKIEFILTRLWIIIKSSA